MIFKRKISSCLWEKDFFKRSIHVYERMIFLGLRLWLWEWRSVHVYERRKISQCLWGNDFFKRSVRVYERMIFWEVELWFWEWRSICVYEGRFFWKDQSVILRIRINFFQRRGRAAIFFFFLRDESMILRVMTSPFQMKEWAAIFLKRSVNDFQS